MPQLSVSLTARVRNLSVVSGDAELRSHHETDQFEFDPVHGSATCGSAGISTAAQLSDSVNGIIMMACRGHAWCDISGWQTALRSSLSADLSH